MGMCDFSLPAIGERHENEDGSSRQEELAQCIPGEPVRLVREPENPHDRMAVAVFSCRGVKVGYLKRDRAVWIGSKIDRGYDVRAIVERVKGATLAGAWPRYEGEHGGRGSGAASERSMGKKIFHGKIHGMTEFEVHIIQ